jgi:hypothetical protein
MFRGPRRGFVKDQIFFWTDHLTKYPINNFSVPYENWKENQTSNFADEFTMKWRLIQKAPFKHLKLFLDQHHCLLEGPLRLDECPLDVPGCEAKLQCLRLDS